VTQNFSPELAFEQLAPSEDGKIIGKQSEWKSMKVKNADWGGAREPVDFLMWPSTIGN